MPTEAITDTPTYTTPEFIITGRHLEAAFFSRVQLYRHRIFEGLGVQDRQAYDALAKTKISEGASHILYQKESQLLHREPDLRVDQSADVMSSEFIMAAADMLARRGMESSIIQPRLDQVKLTLARRRGQSVIGGRVQDYDSLRNEQKALKTVAIACNHAYRNFFLSKAAATLGVDSPNRMKEFLAKSSLGTPHGEQVNWLARGISLEIAAQRYLLRVLAIDRIKSARGGSVSLKFGNSDEDKKGGDIVLQQNGKITYIDLKNGHSEIKDLSDDDRLRGYKYVHEQGIDKFMIWPESFDAVAEDEFRLTDSTLKQTLERIALGTN